MMKKILWIVVGMVLLTFLSGNANTRNIAFVIKVNGSPEIKKNNTTWQVLKRGTHLDSGDQIRTGDEAMVALVFTDDKSMIKIRANSLVTIRGKQQDRTLIKRMTMSFGEMWAKINPVGGNFTMETPVGVAAVKGTEFYGVVDSDGNTIIIGISGIVELLNKLGKILVNGGETGTLFKDKAPIKEKTKSFDNWANSSDSGESIEFEFKDADGNKKYLKLEYKAK